MHFAKQIFKKISTLLHITELQCYTLYLDHALDFRLDFRMIADHVKTDVNVAKQFYGSNDVPPKFFNFKSFSDWGRLNNNIMKKTESLCFYLERDVQGAPGQKEYVKVYDESCITRLFYPAISITRHIFIAHMDSDSRKLKDDLSYVNDKSAWHIYPEASEKTFILHYSLRSSQISECLADILGITAKSTKPLGHDMFDKLTSNSSLLEHIDRPVVVCAHTGDTSAMSYLCRRKTLNPKNLQFASLAIFNERNVNQPLVLCVTLAQDTDKFLMYEPQQQISQEIISACLKSSGRVTGTNDYIKDLANSTEAPSGGSDDELVKNWWQRYICRCTCCELAKNEYSNNISVYGPQKRRSICLDTIEYMYIFNATTHQNMQKLLEVYRLSVAAVDLESFTKKLDRSVGKKLQMLSRVAEKTKTVAVQEISLIGYGDTFLEKPHIKIFDVIPGRKSAKVVVNAFIGHVLERQSQIQKQKMILLEPLFRFTKTYKDAHFYFWLKEFQDNPDQAGVLKTVEHSYNNSLVGCFEKHLRKLASAFYVFAFNGSRYDYVLLHKFMSASLRTRGYKKPFNIIKRDSRIMRMSIPKTGIRFVDICDTIGPGSSLSSFAKLTGLQEEKMVFPFSAFDGVDFLKQKNLPTDKDAWFNELKQKPTSDDDVQKAHADFKRVGAKNIGEYLKIYLKMDVSLLGYGVIRYYQALFDKYKVHPLDVDKTTIASFGAYLYQHNLMKNKRIAHFTPNLLPLYGCLKSASTGGLTMVTRHSADGSDINEDPINSHLSDDHNVKGEFVSVYDVNSLYPSAGLFVLPFGPGIFTLKCKNEDDLMIVDNYDRHSQRLMNSTESQVIQYLTLVRYPTCIRAYSQFHAGPGQICYSQTFKKRVDLFLVLQPGVFKIVQYHDTASHVDDKSSHTIACRYNRNGKPLIFNSDTALSDDQNTRFAKFITDHMPKLTVTYEVLSECDFFHDNPLPEDKNCTQPIKFLREHHPKDSLFKPEWLESGRMIKPKALLDRILNTDECDAGFIVIKRGAKECANDEVSQLFGFCLQKNSPTVEDLGPDTLKLAEEVVSKKVTRMPQEDDTQFAVRLGKAVKKYLKTRLKNNFTLTRKSFIKDQCLPVGYFKFLVRYRQILPTVQILHYIHYEGRDYSDSFIRSLLQSRHNLIRAGLGKSLESKNEKSTSNSMYGGFLMEQCKYHKFTYALEDSLKKRSRVTPTDISLVSAVNTKKGDFSLMYLLKYPQPNKQIENLLQVGATILGFSRVIFYFQIYSLLNVLDSKKAQLLYLDTDSLMLFVASPKLTDCVKEGKSEEFEELSQIIFADPTSEITQAGKLKCEGFYQSGFFRCVKNYVLNPFPQSDEERVVKSKCVPKIIREILPDESFYINDRKRRLESSKESEKPGDLFLQNLCLHPTMGEQIHISVKRRRIANPINCKRLLTKVNIICLH